MKTKTANLGHGSGGRQSAELVQYLVEGFAGRGIGPELEDAALLAGGYAMTVDGFTVLPRKFPGGDIGHLAVCGCANDLAVRGASPDYLGLSLVIEEGFPLDELKDYMESAAATCASIGMTLAAGDTKVVPAGGVEGVLFSGCAFGKVHSPFPLGMANLRKEDVLIVSGPIGRHGAAIAAARFSLEVENLESDCAPLWPAVQPLLSLGGLRCMRDCTRGGLGTVLCEWAEGTGLHIALEEEAIPIQLQVQSLCDILGFDPLYMACEGTLALAVSPEDADKALALLKENSIGREAAVIGHVGAGDPKGMVSMRTSIGGERLVDMPWGELLPRIC